ncbi:MAG: reactive intermediate/imine deaminase [Flavobacteriales bacterium]|nr:reactive intermediate/imine deaminase [Flavobacteriales bacterium]|tara:strand:+ start:152 stop:529 length:378 start_codon:yes stop_codon:yes gene_type:complete
MKKIIETKNAPKAIGPYSQAILINNTLYCSGQIAINPKTGTLINDSLKNETFMVMQNIGEILSAAKMNYSNIVKATIFLKDINQYNEINNIYSKFFTTNKPAREAIEVSRLPKDANIEISVIAVK